MDLDNFREDPEKQNGGTPIYIGDATFFCKRWGTPESAKFIRQVKLEIMGPLHKYQPGDDDLILAEWLAGYGVTNWSGVFSGESELKYSPQNARKVFLNPEYFLSLNQMIFIESQKFQNYLYEQVQEDTEEIKKP